MKTHIVLLLLFAVIRTIPSQCPSGTVRMQRTEQSGDEGDSITVNFVLDCVLVDTDFTVGLTYSNKDAANNDYDTSITTVNIPAGSIFFGTSLQLSSDTTVEEDETFCIVIGSVGSGGAGSDSVVLTSVSSQLSTTVTIINDDTATVSITPALFDHTEGDTDTTATVTLEWSNALQDAGFTQVLSYIDGTAMSSDYTSVSTTITLPTDPVTSIEVPITIIGDTIIENDEIFTVSLAMSSAPASYVNNDAITTHATSVSSEVTILDDDTPDTMPPVISNCPEDISREVELGAMEVSVTWIEPTATDLGPVTLTQRSHQPGGNVPAPSTTTEISTTTVLYIFSNDNGNSAMCSFTISISAVDRVPPTIMDCPSDIFDTVEVGPNEITSVVWTEPSATDISGTERLQMRTHAPGFGFQVGQTTVIYEFVDASGNSATCLFSVIIQRVDTTPPTVINCPSVVTETVELGQPGIQVSWTEPIATDASEPPAVTVVRSRNPGDFFAVGETTITYTFTDSSSNEATCTFTVVVQTLDTTPPTIKGCPEDIIENVRLGNQISAVFWVEPTATDNSGEVQLLSRSHTPGMNSPVDHPTTVTYQFSDNSGNVASCTFTVLVSSVDTTLPTCMNNPVDILDKIELGSPGTTVSWVAPTCSSFSGTASVTEQTHTSPFFFEADSTTVISHTCKDQAGNMGSCSFNVIIQTVDTTPPTVIQGPDHITRVILLGDGGVIVSWEDPAVHDISGTQTLLSRSHSPNSFFPLGSTLVTYLYGDESGNTVTYTFCVTVQEIISPCDSQPCQNRATCTPVTGLTYTCTCPEEFEGTDCEQGVILNCPERPVIVTTNNLSTSVFWPEPKTSLGSKPSDITSNYKPGDDFLVGNTKVKYRFQNLQCVFTVTVQEKEQDSTPPIVYNCTKDEVTVTVQSLHDNVTISLPEPHAEDDSCDPVMVTSSGNLRRTFRVGLTTITYNFTDSSGNLAQCVIKVNISVVGRGISRDHFPIFEFCPRPISKNGSSVSATTQVTWIEPVFSSTAGVLLQQSHYPGEQFPFGITNVTYKLTDINNSQRSEFCIFSVKVNDVTSDCFQLS